MRNLLIVAAVTLMLAPANAATWEDAAKTWEDAAHKFETAANGAIAGWRVCTDHVNVAQEHVDLLLKAVAERDAEIARLKRQAKR